MEADRPSGYERQVAPPLEDSFAENLRDQGRIWMLMFAHAAYDVVAILLIYLNLESRVAHFLFK